MGRHAKYEHVWEIGSKPLSRDEEVLACENHDYEALFRSNVAYVRFIAKPFRLSYQGYMNDLIGYGDLALWECVLKYDAKVGRLSTWATKPIQWAMYRFMRKIKKFNTRHVLDDSQLNVPRSSVCHVDAEDHVEFIGGIMQQVLDEREIRILRLRAERVTLKQVGVELGLTKERVRQIEHRAKAAIHARIELRDTMHRIRG